MLLKSNFFVLLLPSVINAYGVARQQQDDVQHEFELIKLSQHWLPITTCQKFFTNASEITCSPCKSSKASNKWTIHGLWPSNRHGTSQNECTDFPFDLDRLSNELKAKMKHKWPSVRDKSDENFWAYEWKKHGTCAFNFEDTNSLPKYFSRTIELYDNFNITEILNNAGIFPNGKYETEDIHRAFKNSLGVDVFLACVRNEESRWQFLQEVTTCFNRSFGLVDCEPTSPYTENCTNEYKVTYFESC